MSAAIQADGLGKLYRLGQRQRYGALRDSLTRTFKAPTRWLRARNAETGPIADTIWALKDVSFEVQEGEIVGIIGRNGSGKSTLLKILARITEPTTGRAVVRGYVGSLLEVGTGFHPELTGRENVFVNGAILGMKRREIARKFDEIVAFAEVGQFIDTPVKHYSSGMQMRLAFAVAAHLQPEILLVDEVLAVGDLAFQKKCLGKMEDVRHEGRTVLFVSHQMNQLRRLCGRCVWLEQGRVVDAGVAADVINRYEAVAMSSAARDATAHDADAQFGAWSLDSEEDIGHVLSTTGPVTVRFEIKLQRPIRNGHHGIALHDQEGRLVWGTGTDNLNLAPGAHLFVYHFESLPLRPGPYQWFVTLIENDVIVDSAHCLPNLLVSTTPTGHRRDECAGILNLNYSVSVDVAADKSAAQAGVA